MSVAHRIDMKRDTKTMNIDQAPATDDEAKEDGEPKPVTEFVVNLESLPFVCLPADLDQTDLVAINILSGSRWQKFIGRKTGVVHDSKGYWDMLQDRVCVASAEDWPAVAKDKP